MPIRDGLDFEKDRFCEILLTEDAAEGTKAFLEKTETQLQGKIKKKRTVTGAHRDAPKNEIPVPLGAELIGSAPRKSGVFGGRNVHSGRGAVS